MSLLSQSLSAVSRRAVFKGLGRVGVSLAAGGGLAATLGQMTVRTASACSGCGISCIGLCVCKPAGFYGESCCDGQNACCQNLTCCYPFFGGCYRAVYSYSSDSCVGVAC